MAACAGADAPALVVSVLNAVSGEPLTTVRLPGSARVVDVKREVQAVQGINVFRQRLFLPTASVPLGHSDVLGGLPGCEPGSVLTLMLCMLQYGDRRDAEVGRSLLEAAKRDSCRALEEVLQLPAWPDYQDDVGRTPLHVAVGRLEAVQMLCEAEASKDRVDNTGTTPLLLATQTGRVEVARFLCQERADPNLATWSGVTPLLVAAQDGHRELVLDLCEARADPDHASFTGVRPLSMALSTGHMDIAQLLCKARADPNAASPGGSPLVVACQRKCPELARLLLEAGANKDLANEYGTTPLLAACREGAGHLEIAQLLCQAGADPDKSDNYRTVPLHVACYNGHLELVRLLCEARADTSRAMWDGKTPLSIALARGDGEIVRLLEAAGQRSGQGCGGAGRQDRAPPPTTGRWDNGVGLWPVRGADDGNGQW